MLPGPRPASGGARSSGKVGGDQGEAAQRATAERRTGAVKGFG
jgi:hypothetical protein